LYVYQRVDPFTMDIPTNCPSIEGRLVAHAEDIRFAKHLSEKWSAIGIRRFVMMLGGLCVQYPLVMTNIAMV